MSWDEAFADRYEGWPADMTADIAFYVDLARQAAGPLVELLHLPTWADRRRVFERVAATQPPYKREIIAGR